jgi:hypothetical protein
MEIFIYFYFTKILTFFVKKKKNYKRNFKFLKLKIFYCLQSWSTNSFFFYNPL